MPFTVTDVKQFGYCQRILYFTYVLPVPRRVTAKMREGKMVHAEEELRAARRSLSRYGVPEDTERYDEVWVSSERLGLTGRLDMVLVLADEVIPVEYKNSRGTIQVSHRLQLAAAALLAEERWERPVRRGYVHFLPTRRCYDVAITEDLREQVRVTLRSIQSIIDKEALPDPTPILSRCVDCEYLRFCNDRPL